MPIARLKAAKLCEVRQHRECDNRGKCGGEARPCHKPYGCRVSLVGSRREQNDADRGKSDGPRAVRPCGDDPEKRGGADHDEGAPGIDESRKPIGHAKPEAAAPRNRSSRIGDEQSEPVQRVRNARQHFGRLVGEQPQRRCIGRQRDQPAHCCLAHPPQAYGIGDPAGRVCPGLRSKVACRRGSQFLGHRLQNSIRFPSSPVGREAPQAHGHHAPARQSGEQTVDGGLQHRRVIAQLRGLAERLVDYRIKCDDAPREFPSHRLGIVEIGSGHRQRVGVPAGNFGRNGREQCGQPATGAAEIGSGENDAGTYDTNTDLARAGDREHEGLPIRPAGGTKLVARDDRGRVAGERGGIGGEVFEKRGDESAEGAPQREADEKRRAVLRKACGQ